MSCSCLVCHASIIWYGYNKALEKMPKKDESAPNKLKKLMKGKPDRPNAWVSHETIQQFDPSFTLLAPTVLF